MQRFKMFIGVVAVVLFMVPFLAAGTEGAGPFLCDEKVDEVFWLNFPGACYQLKASCKGSAAGLYVSFTRDEDDFSLYTEGDPSCKIESCDDDQAVTALKGACSHDDGQTKLELKRRDDLCEFSCEKPDKDGGCI